MRTSSEVLIHVDVAKALAASIKFYLSRNGVILTPGNERGLLEPQFFEKVERVIVEKGELHDWEQKHSDSPPEDVQEEHRDPTSNAAGREPFWA